ncbi:uncharacterized protein LOC8274377 isoform X1 [Ricinus communis]|uniref:uncharacterized protein LOC8274377 isoform X1 n=1 Tax=Ricinus communis TaxID=3988 RepID=UPI00201A5E6F|nr:uncharacterized protein LOC8274377 isoform X1 [Ricinus communis]XP_015571314.2 uncharacterized protein LOC8274377 isoform X1 [Ricinus communis]XP_048228998.1 uncharacterized protein LOC8274377 isoform X1 [Ricinus communis]
MECNKDEAVRAKEIAERKFTDRDFAGAKKFALKAQHLYPELDGLSQMLVTLDVYASAEKRTITGEVDYYCVLGVSPWADDETVKKQYRKLALMLHPDKNKSLGADGAFKLVSEAWSLLSDKAKRLAYNEKLNVIGFHQNISTHTKVPSAPPTANGFHNSSSAVQSDARTQNKNARAGPPPVPSSYKKPDTFWTICNRCKTQYEYLRIYLNHTLLCPNCHEAFYAVEKAPPNVMKPANHSSRQKHHSRHRAAYSSMFNIGRNGGVGQSCGPEGFGVNSSNDSDRQWNHFSRMAGAGDAVHQAHQQVKREHEETEALAEWKTGNSAFGVDQLFKRRRSDEISMNYFGADVGNGRAGLGSASEQRKGYYETERHYGFSGINSKPNSKRELSFIELRNMLMEKARFDIRKKLEEWRLKQMKLEENKKQKSVVRNGANNHKKHDDSAVMEGNKSKKSFPGFSSDNSSKNSRAPMSINVPDPDFHNFDLDRTESSFGDDQVWAAYDENDGMPRYYARIHKVISLKPFKMRISWLNSRSNLEFSSLDWVGSGFPKTCGDFRAGRHEVTGTLNSFSHKVKWIKGNRGVIRILPSKGDVWALYTNWSPDWNQHTPDEVVHQYDMVEVLDDYSEEQGVSVAPLIKVAGFKTVFHRHMDPNKVKKIPKEEMLRFSHQVPDHLLTDEEAPNAPKGCRELDPAATPLELLQVITEANEAETVDTTLKTEEEVAPISTEIKVDDMVENAFKPKEDGTIESYEQANEN